MAKWCGQIGYASTSEIDPGVWEEQIIERKYYGDVITNRRQLQNISEINDTVNINNQISFVSDPYAMQNFHMMRYATFMGIKWKVTNAEIQYPRITITLGGVYNVEE